jgi:hypothetical protein
MTDYVLIVWLVLAALWDVLVFGMFSYLVFWCGHSGWWFVFALIITQSPTLFRALQKRYGLKKDDNAE